MSEAKKPERFARDGRELPINKCRICGYEMDSASTADNTPKWPRPGDFTLCLRCGEIYVFDKDMRYREPSLAELNEIQQDRINWSLLERAQKLIRQKRPLEHKYGTAGR